MPDKFLFMADVHVKSRTWTNSLQLTGDAYTALNTVLEKLSDQKRLPVTLVIGGDWFDSNRPSSTDILRTNYFLDQFMYVYYIAGNHDNVDPSFLSAFNCNRTVQIKRLSETPEKMAEQDAWIAGVSWMSSAEKLQESIKSICTTWRAEHQKEEVLYLVLHTSFQHLLAFDGAYKLTADFIKSVIGEHTVRILVGDIHVRDTMDLDHPGQYIHSPGSLYPLSLDQTDRQFAVSLIESVTGAIADVPIKVRSYTSVKYTTDEALHMLYNRVVGEADNDPLPPFIRVVIDPEAEVHINTAQFPGAVVQVVRESTESQDERIISSAGCTLLQAAVEEAGDDELLSQLVEGILAADDPLQELKDWLDFWKVKQTV